MASHFPGYPSSSVLRAALTPLQSSPDAQQQTAITKGLPAEDHSISPKPKQRRTQAMHREATKDVWYYTSCWPTAMLRINAYHQKASIPIIEMGRIEPFS